MKMAVTESPSYLFMAILMITRFGKNKCVFSAKHHVISYDLRGYGHSDTPHVPFSNVEDLKLLLDALGLEKTTLVGSSMGGSVAIDFIGSAFRQRPEISCKHSMAGNQTACSGAAARL